MTIGLILLLIAVILFAVSAIGIDAGTRVSLRDLGLACFAASFLVAAL